MPHSLGESFLSLGIALGLGLLVGLQRERARSALGGFRTFALVSMLGAVSALLGEHYGPWPFVVTLVGVSGLAISRSARRPLAPQSNEGGSVGLATEVSMLLMVAVGALVVHGPRELAVALAGCVMVLLQAKLRLHAIARRIPDRDFGAIVQFALISLVILPVLPNRSFGPYDVLNPRHIWLMVVLVVGLSLGAYLLRKLFGERAGLLLNGVLGGLVSSTATTASAARLARGLARPGAAALVVCVACATMLPRVAGLVLLGAPHMLAALVVPFGLLLAASLVSLLVGYWWLQREGIELPETQNPAELRGALVFGLIFAAVSFATAWAQDTFGRSGFVVAAAISGLSDVAAITLSAVGMVRDERIDASLGAQAIVVAVLTNTGYKLAIAGVLGGWRFFVRVLALLLPVFLVTAAYLWFLAD